MPCTDFVWFVSIIEWLWAGYGWISPHDFLGLVKFIEGWLYWWGPLC